MSGVTRASKVYDLPPNAEVYVTLQSVQSETSQALLPKIATVQFGQLTPPQVVQILHRPRVPPLGICLRSKYRVFSTPLSEPYKADTEFPMLLIILLSLTKIVLILNTVDSKIDITKKAMTSETPLFLLYVNIMVLRSSFFEKQCFG